MNHHLASKGVTVTDLREAFRDGVNLILLLEALANRRVGRYNPNPRFPSHKLDNITVALSFIENTWNVKVLGVNPNGTYSPLLPSCLLTPPSSHSQHITFIEINHTLLIRFSWCLSCDVMCCRADGR